MYQEQREEFWGFWKLQRRSNTNYQSLTAQNARQYSVLGMKLALSEQGWM